MERRVIRLQSQEPRCGERFICFLRSVGLIAGGARSKRMAGESPTDNQVI